LQTKNESVLGERMPKKKKEEDWSTIAFVLLLVVLFLKAIGLLKAVFNIDPNGVTFTFDIGYLTSFGLFILLWRRIDKFNDTFSKLTREQSERIAKIEGILSRERKQF
jgi:hypothetical protein